MQGEKGMTLIEVIVALVLLSTAGLSLLRAGQGQVRHLDHMQQKQVALWVAENRLTTIQLEGIAAAKHGLRGESQQAGKRWYWQQRVVATDRQGVYAIEVVVNDTPAMAAPLIRVYTWQSS